MHSRSPRSFLLPLERTTVAPWGPSDLCDEGSYREASQNASTGTSCPSIEGSASLVQPSIGSDRFGWAPAYCPVSIKATARQLANVCSSGVAVSPDGSMSYWAVSHRDPAEKNL